MFARNLSTAHELPAGSCEVHPTHENIAALAYALWQEDGCPEGTDKEHWLRAEQELATNREIAMSTARHHVAANA
jgi:hypothetical protein